MMSAGIADSDLQIMTQPRMLGVAKDILEFSFTGQCDAFLLGRRGLSGLEEIFIGSVSGYLINHFTNGALLIVPCAPMSAHRLFQPVLSE
jgi:nucleotide-binding universal stress UspA family protein